MTDLNEIVKKHKIKKKPEQCFSAWYDYDKKGKMHIRYGSVDIKDKPGESVETYLLNECVRMQIEKERDKFSAVMSKICSDHTKRTHEILERYKDKIAELKETINELSSKFTDICLLNTLKIPSPPRIKAKERARVLRKEEKEEYSDE